MFSLSSWTNESSSFKSKNLYLFFTADINPKWHDYFHLVTLRGKKRTTTFSFWNASKCPETLFISKRTWWPVPQYTTPHWTNSKFLECPSSHTAVQNIWKDISGLVCCIYQLILMEVCVCICTNHQCYTLLLLLFALN